MYYVFFDQGDERFCTLYHRLFVSGTMNFWGDSRSVLPNTHTCLSNLPLLYLRHTRNVASISTITPAPPIGFWFLSQFSVTKIKARYDFMITEFLQPVVDKN